MVFFKSNLPIVPDSNPGPCARIFVPSGACIIRTKKGDPGIGCPSHSTSTVCKPGSVALRSTVYVPSYRREIKSEF